MKNSQSRRDFLKVSVGAACAAPLAAAANEAVDPGVAAGAVSPGGGRIKKAVQIDMLPKKLSYAERFKLARDAAGPQGRMRGPSSGAWALLSRFGIGPSIWILHAKCAFRAMARWN